MTLSEKDIFNRMRAIFCPTYVADAALRRVSEEVKKILEEAIATPHQILNDDSAAAVRVSLDTMKPSNQDKVEFNVTDYTNEDESLGSTNKIFADVTNAMKYAQALADTYGALGVPYEIDVYRTALVLTLTGVEDED